MHAISVSCLLPVASFCGVNFTSKQFIPAWKMLIMCRRFQLWLKSDKIKEHFTRRPTCISAPSSGFVGGGDLCMGGPQPAMQPDGGML